jgi:hypothetical protein
MHDRSPVRCLMLSMTTAAAGAVALALSIGGAPAVIVPTAAALSGSATAASTLGRAAPVLPELLSDRVLADQAAAGLTCATSLAAVPLCTHAPDAGHTASTGGATATPRGGTLGCYGDGTSGPRVRAVYARPQSAPDRYATSLPAIRDWAAGISRQFDTSAARTQGRRHVRFATTPGSRCTLTVLEVVLPDNAFGSFRATIDALQARGLHQSWSKYLVWSEGSNSCGMGTTYADDSPGLDNLNNRSLPAYARVDRRCWGKVETHELVHMLGGVQRSAPNATASFHCSDGLDALCYDDKSSGSRQRQVCPSDRSHLLDCRNDDYFSTAAPRGSYLQTHWNIARSSFLAPTLSEPTPGARAAAPTPSPTASPAAAPTPGSRPSPAPSAEPGLLGLVPALGGLPTLAPVPAR